MQDLPLLISFFTRDWRYPEFAAELQAQCDGLQIDSFITEQTSAGGYLQNCCIKPFFIRETLQSVKRPVLWLDVDAAILQRPTFFCGLSADLSLCAKDRAIHARQWHVGTMWFNYSPATLTFLDQWCALTGQLSDESSLQTLHERGHAAVIEPMPRQYHEIDLPPFKRQADTVIMHRISSGQSKLAQRRRFMGVS